MVAAADAPYVGSSEGLDWAAADAPAATLEAATGPGRGGGDAPAYVGSSDRPGRAAADVPTMGIHSSPSPAVFFGIFSSVVEKMMGQERRLQ
ncbi:hypothetical protein QYE76_043046 [Lolium multiflorum]|uniref:Uncharacterized protein n=1 Tax=Lolium multiflorum TaxID=4521 RepID=A0AAD8TI03_LOLMU|nr:hypothetical protein QYE76_043046 [Lolium multiflorum]